MMSGAARGVFMRMFSSALASQAVLSAASFTVALLLIRRTPDLEFAHYVLVLGAIILAVSLQNSFIGPAMIHRMTRLGRVECGELTGGLYREQRRVVMVAAGTALALTLVLWAAHGLDRATATLVLAAIGAMVAALRREYFRLVLLAYRRAQQVLRADIAFCALLVPGVLLATFSPAPAATAVLASGVAALAASVLLSRTLLRSEAWDARGAKGILREIAPLATWSTGGAAIHWTFSQGYTYLVAATLDVRAVAAIAATRLLAMPVNLLSSGIGSLMLPLASRWLAESGAPLVLRRLLWLAFGIAAAAIGYFTVLWLLRDWVFDVLLKKNFAQRDLLLMLWSAAFVLMVVHQQLLYLLIARERFRLLTPLALLSAVVALACSLWGMQRFGGAGAVLGIVLGELTNTVGVVILCLREVGLPVPVPARVPARPAAASP